MENPAERRASIVAVAESAAARGEPWLSLFEQGLGLLQVKRVKAGSTARRAAAHRAVPILLQRMSPFM